MGKNNRIMKRLVKKIRVDGVRQRYWVGKKVKNRYTIKPLQTRVSADVYGPGHPTTLYLVLKDGKEVDYGQTKRGALQIKRKLEKEDRVR